MKRAARFKTGSVVFDRRRRTWNFLQWENGKRKSRPIGTLQQYPTKSAARCAAQAFASLAEAPEVANVAPTVAVLVKHYRQD